MTTYHSEFPNSVVEQIRRLLLNYDLLFERLKAEIKLRKETMFFYEGSTKRSDLQAFLDAKIEKENYEVFLHRVMRQRRELLKKVALVAKKYEGEYAQVFTLFFFEKKSVEEISEITGYPLKKTSLIVKRMRNDIIDVYKKKTA